MWFFIAVLLNTAVSTAALGHGSQFGNVQDGVNILIDGCRGGSGDGGVASSSRLDGAAQMDIICVCCTAVSMVRFQLCIGGFVVIVLIVLGTGISVLCMLGPWMIVLPLVTIRWLLKERMEKIYGVRDFDCNRSKIKIQVQDGG